MGTVGSLAWERMWWRLHDLFPQVLLGCRQGNLFLFDNKYIGAEFVAPTESSSPVFMAEKLKKMVDHSKGFLLCRLFKLLLEACTVLHLLPTMRSGQLVSMMRVLWVALQVMNQKSQWPVAGKLFSHQFSIFLCCHHCVLVCCAASKIWESADVPLTDACTWGKVAVPSLHGRVVQVAAGNPAMGFSPQFCHENALGHQWLYTHSSVLHSAGCQGSPPSSCCFAICFWA